MNKEDISDIATSLGRRQGVTFVTLVPNEAGYCNFLSLGLGPDGWNHCMGLFFSAVEAHNKANLGKTITESMESYDRILTDAAEKGIRIAGYVSAAFGFQAKERGEIIDPGVATLNKYIDFFFDRGAEVVTLSDLQGIADIQKTVRIIEGVLEGRKGENIDQIGYHPHHVIPEKAVANSLAALELGIRRFDSSLGGSGGCVTGAPGNQPTELLIEELKKRGFETGIDLKKIKALVTLVTEGLYMKIPFSGKKDAISA
jgi:hydroxymethylglutaryl-CoA lyase